MTTQTVSRIWNISGFLAVVGMGVTVGANWRQLQETSHQVSQLQQEIDRRSADALATPAGTALQSQVNEIYRSLARIESKLDRLLARSR